MDRDLVSPGPSLPVEPSAHSGEEETELSNGSAATNHGLLFPASSVTLLGPIDATSFIRLPGQVLPSNMDSSSLACLALHCSPSPSWSSALVADCPPYIPSCTLSSLFSFRASGTVKRAEPSAGPHSPPLDSGSSLPISALASPPVFPVC